jgi:hypothetical protein
MIDALVSSNGPEKLVACGKIGLDKNKQALWVEKGRKIS